MRCAACGYDEEATRRNLEFAKEHGLDEILKLEEMLKPFIPITINYEKQVIDACHTRFHWQTLYACPNCGTVKMEVK